MNISKKLLNFYAPQNTDGVRRINKTGVAVSVLALLLIAAITIQASGACDIASSCAKWMITPVTIGKCTLPGWGIAAAVTISGGLIVTALLDKKEPLKPTSLWETTGDKKPVAEIDLISVPFRLRTEQYIIQELLKTYQEDQLVPGISFRITRKDISLIVTINHNGGCSIIPEQN